MTDDALRAGGVPAPFRADAAAPFSFATPRDGLICGYRFVAGRRGEPIESLDQAVGQLGPEPSRADGGFIWLHMNLSHASTLPWLRAHAEMAESSFEARG